MKLRYIIIVALALVGWAFIGQAETMPEKPTKYFNDYVGLVTPDQALSFNEQLAQFERQTSNQFVVVVYPYMDTESDAADYTQRIAQSWRVGQKDKRNGLVLFVFMKTANGHGHIQAQVGYGLEGAIPDATAFKITQHMGSYFKSRDYDTGLVVGIVELMNASQEEYEGNGKTVAEQPVDFSGFLKVMGWIIFVLALVSIPAVIYYKKRAKRRRGELEERRLQEEQETRDREARWATQRAETERQWREFLRNESPTQRTQRLAAEAVAEEAARQRRAEERERRRNRQSSSSCESGSSSYGGSSSSSSDSSFSSFSSGGGDFGGGGGGSDF